MKKLTPFARILTNLLITISLFLFNFLNAQNIVIDSTFNTDAEIFPFGANDTIYGLSISGSIELNSDTSLVRVILSDTSGNEWMVYEAYPMILPSKNSELTNTADETKHLHVESPYSLVIQLIDASIEISSIDLDSEFSENLESLQAEFKESLEFRKVDSINYIIYNHQMLWFADTTLVSNYSYSSKCALFGYKYNLCGLEYYTGGVFDPVPGVDGLPDNSPMVDYFDWRARHGANDPEKGNYYYNQNDEDDGTGWITYVENQSEISSCTGLCYIYGPLGAIEGYANVYLNYHRDYDLSEQNVLDCDNQTSGDCNGGQQDQTLYEVRWDGIVDENCYKRDEQVNDCRIESPPQGPQVIGLKYLIIIK